MHCPHRNGRPRWSNGAPPPPLQQRPLLLLLLLHLLLLLSAANYCSKCYNEKYNQLTAEVACDKDWIFCSLSSMEASSCGQMIPSIPRFWKKGIFSIIFFKKHLHHSTSTSCPILFPHVKCQRKPETNRPETPRKGPFYTDPMSAAHASLMPARKLPSNGAATCCRAKLSPRGNGTRRHTSEHSGWALGAGWKWGEEWTVERFDVDPQAFWDSSFQKCRQYSKTIGLERKGNPVRSMNRPKSRKRDNKKSSKNDLELVLLMSWSECHFVVETFNSMNASTVSSRTLSPSISANTDGRIFIVLEASNRTMIQTPMFLHPKYVITNSFLHKTNDQRKTSMLSNSLAAKRKTHPKRKAQPKAKTETKRPARLLAPVGRLSLSSASCSSLAVQWGCLRFHGVVGEKVWIFLGGSMFFDVFF